MRWIKPNLKSIYGLLGYPPFGGPKAVKSRTDQIREAMLGAMEACEPLVGGAHSLTIRRIRYAENIHSLWYARSELMAALADLRGESYARTQLATISELFHGYLPKGLSRRPESRF